MVRTLARYVVSKTETTLHTLLFSSPYWLEHRSVNGRKGALCLYRWSVLLPNEVRFQTETNGARDYCLSQPTTESTDESIWRPLWGPIKLGPTHNCVESHQQYEKHDARICCALRRGQRHHATTHGAKTWWLFTESAPRLSKVIIVPKDGYRSHKEQ